MLDEIINKIRNYPKDQFVREAVNENEAFAEDLNIDQMEQGINARNQPITPAYTALTRRIKAAKGQPTNRVTLRDTGDFHRAIFIQQQSDGFEFDSQDFKSNDLQEKYGVDIFGLTDENEIKLSEEILPDLQSKTFNYFTR